MQPGDTFNRAEEIFAAALAQPERERAAFVAQRCGEDTAAREEVLKLLGARDRMGVFLESAVIDFRGQLFGPYRAREEIGRGGMSVVYRGERVDGDFDMRVAIKVVLTQAANAPETQILASLEHPNIARLLDAGATPLGFRYLVMEFVEGQPCTVFASGLTEEQKLRLFLQVTAGVQAAHQALIVHRDLKPDNILVTPEGTVKLLDFGIAKMLTPSGAQTVGARAYTVDYASPEQILGYAASTANDVYSLGVLLCELVGGRLPRQLTGLPLEEVVRQVQQDSALDMPLEGDLALIARKALRREPAERYESAGALARDIERYLAGEPVDARPPAWRYRAGKFVQRHRYAVAASALAVIALAATSAIAVRQARLAELRFGQVRGLARAVMFELHDAVEPLSGSLPARQLIVQRSLKYLDALAGDANANDEVLIETARGYLRLAEIQGKDNEKASVGQSGEALRQARQAVDLARRIVARSPGSVEAKSLLVDSLDTIAGAQIAVGRGTESMASAREASALADQLLAADPTNRGMQEKAASAAMQMADAFSERDETKNAIVHFSRATQLYNALLAADPGSQEAQSHLARAYNYLCGAYYFDKNKPEAARVNRLALDLSKKLYLANPRKFRAMYATDLGSLALFEGEAGRRDREVEGYREQLRLRREMEADNPKDMVTALRVGATLDRIGFSYKEAGKYPEAIAAGEAALVQIRRVLAQDAGNDHANRELFYALADLAASYSLSQRADRACPLAQEAVRLVDGPLQKSPLATTENAKRVRQRAIAACAAKR